MRLDIPAGTIDWDSVDLTDVIFVDCALGDVEEVRRIQARGAVVMPRFPDRPYDPYRPTLYTSQELETAPPPHFSTIGDATPASTDEAIYLHFRDRGGADADLVEALAQRIHDWSIDEGIDRFLAGSTRPVVGLMGGHSAARGSGPFRQGLEVAWRLAGAGLTVASGGGPGVMEAANLGAWLSESDQTVLDDVTEVLARAPEYHHPEHRSAAQAVLDAHPTGTESLSIPTWFYGHEPSNVFATHVAKYFSNSIREDRLLAICKAGIVFTPGSAGTAQEVFQDAAQNHYETFGPAVPMVFLGTDHWRQTGIWQAVTEQARPKPYRELLTLVDDPAEAAAFILEHL